LIQISSFYAQKKQVNTRRREEFKKSLLVLPSPVVVKACAPLPTTAILLECKHRVAKRDDLSEMILFMMWKIKREVQNDENLVQQVFRVF